MATSTRERLAVAFTGIPPERGDGLLGAVRRERERSEDVQSERQQILVALRAHRGNKAEAARSLGGMKRTTLIYKIERLGIRPEEYLGID